MSKYLDGPIINTSGYLFFDFDNAEAVKEPLKAFCREVGLKGSILLSLEGTNQFLSGTREQLDAYCDFWANTLNLPPVAMKESHSGYQPFKRMLVKFKQEIITMRCPEISPAKTPAPEITPEQFKAWYDESKPMLVLDTRNDYEIELGTFKDAIHLNIQKFTDFPEQVSHLLAQYENVPIVSFCTGGIRCEKAAPLMMHLGFREVYQLQGGILNYFEKVGGDHWHGECFVFDKRVAVDANLKETETVQCYACRMPLSKADQSSEDYVVAKHCPKCINRHKAA